MNTNQLFSELRCFAGNIHLMGSQVYVGSIDVGTTAIVLGSMLRRRGVMLQVDHTSSERVWVVADSSGQPEQGVSLDARSAKTAERATNYMNGHTSSNEFGSFVMKAFALFIVGIIAAIGLVLLAAPARGTCDPSYPTVCIAPPLPDLDCKDVSVRRFSVTGSDPHGFDSDGDGIGCE